MARLILSWLDVEALIEHLLPQFYGSFDAILMIARGGIIPGAMIAERLELNYLLTADVHFPAESSEVSSIMGDRIKPPIPPSTSDEARPSLGLPYFHQFPENRLLEGRRTLIVQHIWNHGRTINAVAGRVQAAGGSPQLCVLHYKPGRSIFPQLKPDFFAAITNDYIVYPWEVSHHLEPYRPMPEKI